MLKGSGQAPPRVVAHVNFFLLTSEVKSSAALGSSKQSPRDLMAVVEHRRKRQAHDALDDEAASKGDDPMALVEGGRLITAPLKQKVSESHLH